MTESPFLHPHLPRQLHWSLEYCAVAPHVRTAVIQSAVHGPSMVACPLRRTPDPAQQTHQTSTRRAAPNRKFRPKKKKKKKKVLELRPARGGYIAGSVETNLAFEAEKVFDKRFFIKKKNEAVCARCGTTLFKKTYAAFAMAHVSGGACQQQS